HIGTRWRCSVLLCNQARAELPEMARNGSTRWLGSVDVRYPICGTFFDCCCASARRTEARTKPASKTTIVFLPIPALVYCGFLPVVQCVFSGFFCQLNLRHNRAVNRMSLNVKKSAV